MTTNLQRKILFPAKNPRKIFIHPSSDREINPGSLLDNIVTNSANTENTGKITPECSAMPGKKGSPKNQTNIYQELGKQNRKKLTPVLFYGSSDGKEIARNGKKDVENPFNKLAQLRKGQLEQPFPEVEARVKKASCNVKGEKTDKQFFTAKQRSKMISFALARKLSELESPLKKSYVNTLFCNSQIEKQIHSVTSKYCKNRVCPLCNRIRTAQLISAYVPEFQSWEDLSFVTLTIPNIPGKDLRDSILEMERAFKKLVDVFRKREQPLKCVRKLEVTWNPKTDEFHPHFHIISEGLRGDIIALWKHYLPEIDYQGQDIKRATEGSAKELFKYFSKVVFKGKFDAKALDTILQSVAGKRVFRSYGFKLSKEMETAQEIEKLESQILTLKYYQNKSDGLYQWINDEKTWISEAGEILHPYKPEKKTEKLLSKITGLHVQAKNRVPGDQAPGGQAPGGRVPGDQVPGDQVPGDQDPGGRVPGDQAPGDQAPGDQAPGGRVPGDQVPGGRVPGDQVPGDQAPGDQAPGDQAPGGRVPGDQVPGDQAPGDQAPGGRISYYTFPGLSFINI